MGLEVRPPDVNFSYSRFTPVKGEMAIRYGLAGIKGVGTAAAEAIVAERDKNGPYRSFMDFCVRLGGPAPVGADGKKAAAPLNRRVLENLVRCGAFDSFISASPALHRSRFFANAEFALRRAAELAKEKSSAQGNFLELLDGGGDSFETDDSLVYSPRWSTAESLRYERELLGMYLTGHPLGAYEHVLSKLSTFSIATPPKVPFMHEVRADRQVKVPVRLCGLLESCQVKMSRPKGPNGEPKPWAILTIDDSHDAMEALAFAATYDKMKDWLPGAVETPILVCGELVHRTNRDTREEEEGLQFLVREAYSLADGIATFSTSIHVGFRYDDSALESKLQALAGAVAANPGPLAVHVLLKYPDGTVVTVELGGGVSSSESIISEIGRIAADGEWGLDVKPDIFAEPQANHRWR